MTRSTVGALQMPAGGGLRRLTEAKAKHPTRWRWVMVLLIMLLPALAACQGKDESAPVGIVGYNHTDTTIAQFLINGGNGDSFIDAHTGGGSTSCCAMIPDHWRPGMKVEISWTTDLKTYHKQMVPIPEYDDKAGHMAVHFLRNGEVRVYVSNLYLGHPDYPLTGPEAGLSPGEDPVREDLRRAKEGAEQ